MQTSGAPVVGGLEVDAEAPGAGLGGEHGAGGHAVGVQRLLQRHRHRLPAADEARKEPPACVSTRHLILLCLRCPVVNSRA